MMGDFFSNNCIASLLILFPLLCGIFVMLTGKIVGQKLSKVFCLTVSVIELILIFILWINFPTENGIHFIERYNWMPSVMAYTIEYIVGIDNLSIQFLLLTAILIPLCLLASWNYIKHNAANHFALFLIAEAILIGFFVSINLLMFYIFFEAILIPLFLIIGIWGGEKRIYATYKFFLYTFAGSLLMLIAIIYIMNHGHYDWQCIPNNNGLMGGRCVLPRPWQNEGWVWWFIFIGLAIKIPMWPFHTWLPYAHVQAPTGGSMILAGVMLKMGAYGMLRLLINMFPVLSVEFANIVIVISIIGMIYTSLIALVQTDMKKLIAYSSVAHMGYVTAGIFSGTVEGMVGSVMQMISHGIISPGLFFIVGALYERTHTREIAYYGGVAKMMPQLAIFFMILLLGAVGLPGTSGFIGEFSVIVATMHKDIVFGVLLSSGVVLGAIYMLKLYANVMFGETNKNTRKLYDLSAREWIVFGTLSFLTILLGLKPSLILDTISASVQQFDVFFHFSKR